MGRGCPGDVGGGRSGDRRKLEQLDFRSIPRAQAELGVEIDASLGEARSLLFLAEPVLLGREGVQRGKERHVLPEPFFREAALRRQIIMVTHNANLVVNADSDQVIVATSERAEASELPNFGYQAGGLEDSNVRRLVCQYLEGGEDAFRRRAARYGDVLTRGSALSSPSA